MWEYLESDHMDERFRVANEAMTRHGIDWKTAFVLDLDCGFKSRWLLSLPAVQYYIGNDIALVARAWPVRHVCEVASLMKMSDEQIPEYLEGLSKVSPIPRIPTVLACFGFSTVVNTPVGLLFATLESTYRGILRDVPEFAVLETPMRWLKPPWEDVMAWPEWSAYEVEDIDVHFHAAEHLEWRRVRVAKRK